MTRSAYAIRLSWRNALVSVLVTAALWALPWLVWPVSHLRNAGARRPPPLIRYIRSAEGLDGATWSPVVFPLPTREGFSKKAVALESGSGMVSLLKPHVAEPCFLDMGTEAAREAAIGMLTVGDEVAFRPEAVGRGGIASNRTAATESVQIDVDGPLLGRRFDASGLRKLPWGESGTGWMTLIAYVEINEKGRVEHVFLETPSGQAQIDGSAIRALAAGSGDAGPGTVRGRVRVTAWNGAKTNGDVRK